MTKAIKRPDVLGHSAGTKTIQQALAEPGTARDFSHKAPLIGVGEGCGTVCMAIMSTNALTPEFKARRRTLEGTKMRYPVLRPNLEGGRDFTPPKC